MRLHQLGHRKVVALMGSSLSTAQEELIRRHTPRHGHLIMMLDEDEAGRAARQEIAQRLAMFAFVRIHAFEQDGQQPEQLTADAAPQHIAFSDAGKAAYVASGDDGTMRVHALDGRLLRTSRIPVGSFNVTHGAGHVVSPSLERGTLCILDRNGRVRRTVRVAPAAHDVCLIRVGSRA